MTSSPANLPCPACGFRTLTGEGFGSYELCGVCGSEDDGVQLANPACGGGANAEREERLWRNREVVEPADVHWARLP